MCVCGCVGVGVGVGMVDVWGCVWVCVCGCVCVCEMYLAYIFSCKPVCCFLFPIKKAKKNKSDILNL